MGAVSTGSYQWGVASFLVLGVNVIRRTRVSGEVIDGGIREVGNWIKLGNVRHSSV